MNLVWIAPMNVPWAVHSIIWTNFGVIVAGGITTGNLIEGSCEIYDESKQWWWKLASMAEPCFNANICLFRNEFLLKIGGKVSEEDLCIRPEIYDIRRDFWTSIKTNV